MKTKKSSESNYKMFVDGKFNSNIPVGFNFSTMAIERQRSNPRTYETNIKIID